MSLPLRWVEAMLSENYRGHNIVFIVGSPRSGTTWLQRLLATHPNVRTGQESDLFDAYIGPQLRAWRRDLDPAISGRSAIGLGCYLTEADFRRLLREYMLKLLEPMVGSLGPSQLFLEKTPSHALYIPEIVEMLPESRIIHVLRDGRDVTASLLASAKSWGANWAPRKARDAARMWAVHVEAARRAASSLPKEQFLEVRYERLYETPVPSLKRVCEFLGIDWSDHDTQRAVEVNTTKRAKETGGTPIPVSGELQKRSGEVLKEPGGFVRKGCPGGWREDLSMMDKMFTWLTVRRTMRQAGYAWRAPW